MSLLFILITNPSFCTVNAMHCFASLLDSSDDLISSLDLLLSFIRSSNSSNLLKQTRKGLILSFAYLGQITRKFSCSYPAVNSPPTSISASLNPTSQDGQPEAEVLVLFLRCLDLSAVLDVTSHPLPLHHFLAHAL